jgi:hypothetical protein
MALLLDVPWVFLGILLGTFSNLEAKYRLKQAAMHGRALSAASSNFEG